MKISSTYNISTTNTKGQLVIPQSMRKKLNISPQVPLEITLKGNSISITPIEDVLTRINSESSYLQILRATQGSWVNEPQKPAKRALELAASAKRKKPW